jgi:hypothetical protein
MNIIEGQANAEYALQLLRATGLKPPFGFDAEGAEQLWATQLAGFPPEVIERAVIEWSKEIDVTFPSMGEFVNVCEMSERHMRREAAIRRGLDNPQPDRHHCPECGEPDSDPKHPNTAVENAPGWVNMTQDDDGFGIRSVRPCSLCRPEQYAAWRNGCFTSNHRKCPKCDPKMRRAA